MARYFLSSMPGYADFITSEKAKEMGFRELMKKLFNVRGAEPVRSVLDQKKFSKIFQMQINISAGGRKT